MFASLMNRPYLLLVITTMIWGANAIAARLAVGHVSPMVLSTFRWVLTLLVLYLVARQQIENDWPVIKTSWKRVAFLGSIGFTVFSLFNYSAAYYTTAINMGIIQGAIPVMVLLGALIAYRTPVSIWQWVGVSVTLVGVLTLAVAGDFSRLKSLTFNTGDLYMMGASIAYAYYTVGVRERPPISGLSFFAVGSVGATLSSAPFMVWEIAAGHAYWPDAQGWAVMFFAALFPSVIAQIIYLRSVELVGPGRAGIFINAVPLWAALMGVLLIGEPFAWYHAAALALVLGGIGIAEIRKPAAV